MLLEGLNSITKWTLNDTKGLRMLLVGYKIFFKEYITRDTQNAT